MSDASFLTEIQENCKQLHAQTAYSCSEEKLTWGELWQKACALAAFLKEDGVGPVLVYGHKSPDMPVSFLACLLSGRAYLPCDSGTPPARIRRICEISGAQRVIFTEDTEMREQHALTKRMLADIYSRGGGYDFCDNPNRTAYIIFTSGSTGEPKGVPITVGNLQNFINWVTALPAIAELGHGAVLNQAAFSFDLSVADLYIALVTGRPLFALTRQEQRNPCLLFARVKESGCELAVCTPTFLQGCLLNAGFNRTLLPALRTVFCCGEPLLPATAKKLLARFPGIRVLNAYGPTEATCAVCAAEVEDWMLTRPALPVGRIGQTAVNIRLDSTLSSDEIVLRGASVSPGYLGAQSAAFRDGCYYTGDIGRVMDGWLYCLGRKDDQIKYKGYRIEPAEIEHCLCRIEGINSAAVLPIENGRGKILRLCAAVQTMRRDLTTETIKAELKRTLPVYMIPKTIAVYERLPVNANGKCDRNRLREGFLHGENG